MAVGSGVPQLSGSIAPGYSEYSALMPAPASRQSAALSLPSLKQTYYSVPGLIFFSSLELSSAVGPSFEGKFSTLKMVVLVLNPYACSLVPSSVSNTLSVSVQEADGLPDINSAPSTGKLYSPTRPKRPTQHSQNLHHLKFKRIFNRSLLKVFQKIVDKNSVVLRPWLDSGIQVGGWSMYHHQCINQDQILRRAGASLLCNITQLGQKINTKYKLER